MASYGKHQSKRTNFESSHNNQPKNTDEQPSKHICIHYIYKLVVSTHLKNISQIGNLPQLGMNIKNS